MKNLLLYFSKRNPSVNPLCVSFLTNWFTTWLTNTTFHNGDMHNVQHSQAMLERGVCELAHFFFHFMGNWFVTLQCKTIISILFNLCGDTHLWVGVTKKTNKHWSPTNNEDSSVHVILGSSQWITPGCNADITQSNDTMQSICTVSSFLCWLSVFYMFFFNHDCLYHRDWFVYGKEGFVSFGLCWVNILFFC